jgi:flagellar basal body P-ring formation protein FlgA
MRLTAILVLLVAFAGAGGLRGACLAVPTGNIRAQDLAQALPSFGAIAPDTFIAFAPFPGAKRVLTSHDLAGIARRFGVAVPGPDPVPSLCVERIVHPLAREEVAAALRSALDNPEAQLEILDFSNKLVPPGRLEFPLAALNGPPVNVQRNDTPAPVLWPGKLVYDAGASMAVWAKVRISIEREVLVAAHNIAPGDILTAGEISTRRMAQFPAKEIPSLDGSAILGRVARRPIPAGQRILPEMLEEPKDVRGGATVHVQVVEGAATITLDGVAQASGLKGDSILVHNPLSGKNFRAIIQGPNQVLVTPGLVAPISRFSAPSPGSTRPGSSRPGSSRPGSSL